MVQAVQLHLVSQASCEVSLWVTWEQDPSQNGQSVYSLIAPDTP
jgi:hypothetical protein